MPLQERVMEFFTAEGDLNTSKASSTIKEGSVICQRHLKKLTKKDAKLSVECTQYADKYLGGNQDVIGTNDEIEKTHKHVVTTRQAATRNRGAVTDEQVLSLSPICET